MGGKCLRQHEGRARRPLDPRVPYSPAARPAARAGRPSPRPLRPRALVSFTRGHAHEGRNRRASRTSIQRLRVSRPKSQETRLSPNSRAALKFSRDAPERLVSALCGEHSRSSEMPVLEGELGSAAPSTIERWLLDHAYSGHGGLVVASQQDRQRERRRQLAAAGRDDSATGTRSAPAAQMRCCGEELDATRVAVASRFRSGGRLRAASITPERRLRPTSIRRLVLACLGV